MPFGPPPRAACWQHRGLRAGFEVTYFSPGAEGLRVTGATNALQDGEAWIVSYRLDVDDRWCTRRAHVVATSASGTSRRQIETDGDGHWTVDGSPMPHLDGCRDVDLESSAMTNALPVHRLDLAEGASADAPAAYVRARSPEVERLDQRYRRLADHRDGQQYWYEAPAFDFRCRLTYDQAGLVLDYPEIAIRAG